MQGAFDALYPAGQQWYWRGDFVDSVPDEAVAVHHRFAEALPTPQSTMHLYPIDGAVHRVAPGDTAWGRREATFSQVIVGVDPDPALTSTLRRWAVDYSEALRPFTAAGGYVNFLMADEPDKVRASYGENYDRLAALKERYDPQNVLRNNQNVPPAG